MASPLAQWCQNHTLLEFMQMMEDFNKENNNMAKITATPEKEVTKTDEKTVQTPLQVIGTPEHLQQRLENGEQVFVQADEDFTGNRVSREFRDGVEVVPGSDKPLADKQAEDAAKADKARAAAATIK